VVALNTIVLNRLGVDDVRTLLLVNIVVRRTRMMADLANAATGGRFDEIMDGAYYRLNVGVPFVNRGEYDTKQHVELKLFRDLTL